MDDARAANPALLAIISYVFGFRKRGQLRLSRPESISSLRR